MLTPTQSSIPATIPPGHSKLLVSFGYWPIIEFFGYWNARRRDFREGTFSFSLSYFLLETLPSWTVFLKNCSQPKYPTVIYFDRNTPPIRTYAFQTTLPPLPSGLESISRACFSFKSLQWSIMKKDVGGRKIENIFHYSSPQVTILRV